MKCKAKYLATSKRAKRVHIMDRRQVSLTRHFMRRFKTNVLAMVYKPIREEFMNLISLRSVYDSNVLDCKMETYIFSNPFKDSFPLTYFLIRGSI
jgi:hypothetical protein